MVAKRFLAVGISLLCASGLTEAGAGVQKTRPVTAETAYYFGQANFPGGLAPTALVSGDFNEDGIADFLVARPQDSAVGLLLGRPDATFRPPIDFATGAAPVALAAGDFNRDGHLDVAVVDQGSNSISILLGRGDGTFRIHVDYAVGSTPAGIAVGDFNGDGIPDVAVTNRDSNSVSTLLGKGDGTFLAAVSWNAGGSPEEVMAADLNGDGKMDLVVADVDFNGGIALLLGNGDGTFLAPVVLFQGLESPFFGSRFTVADLNGDQVLDLAVTTLFPDLTLSVLLGNGDGTFRSPIIQELGGQDPSEVVPGEFHGGSVKDLLLMDSAAGTVSLLRGNGDGTFAAAVAYGGGPSCSSPVVGDFNRDGKLDVGFAVRGANAVGMLLGNGDATFSTRRDYSAGRDAAAVVAADFHRSGFPDLAVVNELDATVSVLPNNGKGAFGSPVAVATGPNPTFLVSGDFNGDGNPDLAVATANGVSILIGAGDGTFAPHADYAAGPDCQQVIAVDFNGDGNLDVAVVNSGTLFQGNTVSVLLGNGDGTFQAQKILTTTTGPAALAAGDFNKDGKLDLAVGFNNGGIAVFLGQGDGSFTAGANYATPEGVRSIASGDLNGDSIPDLVVPGAAFTAHGDGTFESKADAAIGRVVYLVDLDRDGNLDLLTVTPDIGSNIIAVRFGTGDGILAPPRYFAAGVELFSIAAADLNGDGATDLVASNLGTNDVSTVSVYLESPVVALSQNPVSFSTQKVGKTSRSRTVTLYNPGTAPLENLSLVTTGDFEETNDCGSTVAAGSGCSIHLTFTPTTSGNQEGTLVLSDNAPGSPQRVNLVGKGK